MSRVVVFGKALCNRSMEQEDRRERFMSDLISRQVAIDTLEEGFKDATEGVDKLSPTYGLIKAVTGIYKCLIGKLPPEPHWISCSERLPEEDVDVLCQTFGGTILVASYGTLYPYPWSTEKGWITAEFTRFSKETVTAWMPLPEPYKAEGSGSE